MKSSKNIRSLFISDVHLGSKYTHVKELIEFLSSLKKNPPKFIYIVGDFIDGWKLRRNWYWTDESNTVIKKLLGLVDRGTKLYIVSGNHDDFLREFIKDYNILNFGNIHLGDYFIHESKNKKYLIIHGDLFDVVAKYAKWLCILGDFGYEFLLKINHYLKRILRIKWSLSKSIKYNVKKAVNYIGDFEQCLSEYSKTKNCQGVISGHIHHAADKQINEIHYMNCGDWVESMTYITEDEDGNFSLNYFNQHS